MYDPLLQMSLVYRRATVSGDVWWRLLPRSDDLRVCLQTATAAIERLLSFRPHVSFKIGITLDPERRYHDPRMGYGYLEPWRKMLVLLRVQAWEARTLERSLIARFRDSQGCRNVAPGGEGMSDTGQHACVYIVTS